jgi:DNA-binding beta-propeller fold protein YncE
VAVAAAVGLAGCGQPRGVLFPALDEPLRWPAPPELARVEYVGQLVTSEDLQPAKSFGQALAEGLFGAEDVRSMLSPYALTTDGAGRLFVADSNAQVVHVFDLEQRRYERWTPPEAEAPFAQPVAVVVDAKGQLLVADSVAGSISVFAADGSWRGSFAEGLLSRPCGLAIHPADGRIFVADAGAHQVAVFDAEARLVRRLGDRGEALGFFNFPTHVAVDRRGRLYVSDTLNFRVQVFSPELEPIGQIGAHGDLPGYFSLPKGLALDSDDHLYVVDAQFESIQLFDDQGRLLLSFGSEGNDPGEFWLPAGIHVDSTDRIWVADSYNRRVQVFQYLGGAP